MTASWKERLPSLLRLAFILPVLAAVTINVIVTWPLVGEDPRRHPVMAHGTLGPCLQMVTEVEHDRIYNSRKKLGALTYIKRNYKKWLKIYNKYKLKKVMQKLSSLAAPPSQKSSE